MRSWFFLLALGGCASAVPHPAADPANPGQPLAYRPLGETAPAMPTSPPLDWRGVNDEVRAAAAGAAGHKH